MGKKNMTLEDIARLIENRAQGHDVRFDKIEARIETLASREDLHRLKEELLSEMDKKFLGWVKPYATLHDWVKDLDERLMRLEAKSGPRRR